MSFDPVLQAYELGVGDDCTLWVVAPDHLGHRILETAKRTARFLGKALPDKAHSGCLEVVSKAAGFPSWHVLQSMAQALIGDFKPDRYWGRPDGGFERAAALAPAFPMLVRARNDCPPSTQEQRGMRLFADRLAACGEIPLDQALTIVARMNGSNTWDELLQRRPEESAEALYRFEANDDEGRFIWSEACHALVEEQDDLYQSFSSMSAADRNRCDAWIAAITQRRPDFLEGLLAKATTLSVGSGSSWREAGKVYADAIHKAEQLIPDGFKGAISWLHISNRFYHRLLYGYMEWNIESGRKTQALALARKQLRLNKLDNLGLRYFLPVLLAANRKLSSAQKAFKAFQDDSPYDGAGWFVRSLVYFAAGQRREAAKQLMVALFLCPELRDIVAGDRIQMQNVQRHVRLDLDSHILQIAAIGPHVSGLQDTFDHWIVSRAVHKAEADLQAIYESDGGQDAWLAAVLERADTLAAQLVPAPVATG